MILPDIELLARERQAVLRREAEEARQSRLAERRARGATRPGLRLSLPRFGRH
jgi:hypothetical protein